MFRIGYCEALESAPLLRARVSERVMVAGKLLQAQRVLGYGAMFNELESGRLDAAIMPCLLAVMLQVGLGRPTVELMKAQLLARQGGAFVYRADAFLGQAPVRMGFAAPKPPEFWLGRAAQAGLFPAGKEIKAMGLPVMELVPRLVEGGIAGFFGPDALALEACARVPGLSLVSSARLAPQHPSTALVFRRDVAVLRSGAADETRKALARAGQECQTVISEPGGWGKIFELMPGQAATVAIKPALFEQIGLSYVSAQVPGWQKSDTDFIYEKARVSYRSRGDFKDKITELFAG